MQDPYEMEGEQDQEGVPRRPCDKCGEPKRRNDLVEISGQLLCAACKQDVVQLMKEGEPDPTGVKFGGFWVRFRAKFVDLLIVQTLNILCGFLIGMGFFTFHLQQETAAASMIVMEAGRIPGIIALQISVISIGNAFWLGYNTYFLGKFAATPGKLIWNLKVVSGEHEHISYMHALGRTLAEYLSYMILLIGYIIAAFDDQKRTLHDRIANTRVIRE